MKYGKKLFIRAAIRWAIASSICAVAFFLGEALILFILHVMSADIDMSGALSVAYVVQELIRVCPYAIICGLLVAVRIYHPIKRNEHTTV